MPLQRSLLLKILNLSLEPGTRGCMLYRTFSIFKTARQIGLKGLLAGAEWWLSEALGCEPRLVLLLLTRLGQLGRWPLGKQEEVGGGASDRTGAGRPLSGWHKRAASTILATRFVGRHPIPAVSLDGRCASAVCGSSGSLSWERSLRRSCGSSPVSSPGGTKVLLLCQWKVSNWGQSGSDCNWATCWGC